MIQLHITPAEVRSWDPCSDYTDDHIADLFGDRSALTPREIAVLEIPARDRVWALCHVIACRVPGTIEQFTEWCAGRAEDAAYTAASAGAYDAAAAAAAYAGAAAADAAAAYAAAARAYAADYAACAAADAAADAAAYAAAAAAYAAAAAAYAAAYAADASDASDVSDAYVAECNLQIAKALELIEGRKETP